MIQGGEMYACQGFILVHLGRIDLNGVCYYRVLFGIPITNKKNNPTNMSSNVSRSFVYCSSLLHDILFVALTLALIVLATSIFYSIHKLPFQQQVHSPLSSSSSSIYPPSSSSSSSSSSFSALLPPAVLSMRFTNGVIQDVSSIPTSTLTTPSSATLDAGEWYIDATVGYSYVGGSGPILWNMNFPSCSNYTLAAWIKITIPTYGQAIRLINNTGYTGPINIEFYKCGVFIYETNVAAIDLNKWFYLTVAYDNSNNQVTYSINGDQVYQGGAWVIPSNINNLISSQVSFYSSFSNSYLTQPVHTGYDLGPVDLYCTSLSPNQLVLSMNQINTPIPIALDYPLGNTSGFNTNTIPYPMEFILSNDYLKAEFCSTVQPIDVDNQPITIPSSYNTFYVDQVNGLNANLGTSPETAFQSLDSLIFLGSYIQTYSFVNSTNFCQPICFDDTGAPPTMAWFNSSGVEGGGTPPVINSTGLFNGCPSLHFNANTSGYMDYIAGTGPVTNLGGFESGGEYSEMRWLNVHTIIKSPTIFTINGGSHGGGTKQEYIQTNNSTSYTYCMLSVCTALKYSTWYHILFSGSLALNTQALYINGVLATSVRSAIPVGGYGSCGGCQTCEYWVNSGSWVGDIALHTSYTAYFTAISALSAYQYLIQTSGCSLYNQCTSVQLCQGDRHYQTQVFSIVNSLPIECPLFVGSYSCSNHPSNTYPLISAGVLLPQTSQISWVQLTNYSLPSGALSSQVYRYNLTQLYEMGFLTFDPRSTSVIWQPVLFNTAYYYPRSPNIIDPNYIWGRTYGELMQTMYDYPAAWTNCPGNNNYANWYFTPGSWCKVFYYDMFHQNQTAYDYFLFNTSNFAGTSLYIQDWNYFGTSNPVYRWNNQTYLNCSLWYETEIRFSGFTASNLSWHDPTLYSIGIWSQHSGQFNCTDGLFQDATYGFSYPALSINDQVAYGDESGRINYLNQNQNIPVTSNPSATNSGGVISTSPGVLLQGIIHFDGAGEFMYDSTKGLLYVIPWNEAHAAALQTITTIEMNAITWAQHPELTGNWTEVMNAQVLPDFFKPGSRPVFLGAGTLAPNQPPTYTFPNNGGGGVIVQELEFTYYMSGPDSYSCSRAVPYGMYIIAPGTVFMRNVSIHHTNGGMFVEAETLFVINSTLANFTWYTWGMNIVTDGAVMDSTAAIYLIETEFYLWNIGVASDPFLWIRGGRYLRTSSYTAIYTTPSLVEHALVNQTGWSTAEDGLWGWTVPDVFVWRYTDWDVAPLNWNNVQEQQKAGQLPTLPSANLYNWGTENGAYFGTWDFDTNYYKYILHSNRWLNRPWTYLTESMTHVSYYFDTLTQFRGNYAEDGGFEGWDSNGLQYDVNNQEASAARGFGYLNNFFWHRNSTQSSLSRPYHYPLFGPAVSSNYLWYEKQNAKTQYWTINNTICYANMNGVQAVDDDMSYSLYDGWQSGVLSAYDYDLNIANVYNIAPPITGTAYCYNAAEAFEQQVINEKRLHWTSTQPLMEAIVDTWMPFTVPITAVPAQSAQLWQPAIDSFTGVTEPWPTNLSEYSTTNCYNRATCQSYLICDLSPSSIDGSWQDATGIASGVITQNTAPYWLTGTGPWLSGSTYDPQRGRIIDTRASSAHTTQLTGIAMSYSTITLAFWLTYPWGIPGCWWCGGKATTLYGQVGGSNYLIAGAIGLLAPPGEGAFPFTFSYAGQSCGMPNPPDFNWHHYVIAYYPYLQRNVIYMDGQQVGRCSNPVGPHQNGTWFLMYAPFQMADFKIYGAFYNATLAQQLYQDALASYNAPILFQILNPSTGMLVNMTYSTVIHTFTIGDIASTPFLFLNIFGASQQGITMIGPYFLNPAQQAILTGSQFSIPTPQGLSTYRLSIQVAWITTPSSCYWWRIQQTPTNDTLVVQLTAANQICLIYNLVIKPRNPAAFQTSGTACFPTFTNFTANTPYSIDWFVQPTSIALHINGTNIGSIIIPSGQATLNGALAFQVPKATLSTSPSYPQPVISSLQLYNTSI